MVTKYKKNIYQSNDKCIHFIKSQKQTINGKDDFSNFSKKKIFNFLQKLFLDFRFWTSP